jgi:hypothetical protein
MKPGQIVKFKYIVDQGDELLRFEVLEVNGDRCLVAPIMDMVIRPTSTYLTENLQVVELAHWLSTPPKVCEVCEWPITNKFYDAATNSLRGPWACMCQTCFTRGPGLNKLGLGIGQRYELKAGQWICTGGGEQS